jgi:hypothetical protein
LWKSFKNWSSFSLFRRKMAAICGGLLGFATNTWQDVRLQHGTRMYKNKSHFEDVERLKLDVLAPVAKEVHHHLQVRLDGDVAGHHIEVCPI